MMHLEILSNLVITNVRSVSTMYTPQNTKAKRNCRPCWAFLIKFEGETVYTSGGKHFLSDRSHVVILPKGCSYQWQCTAAGHYTIMEFESEQVFFEPLSFCVKNSERLLHILQELEYRRNLKIPMIRQESIRDAYSILLALAQEAESYSSSEMLQKIAPAIAYISQHYSEKITNDALATHTGLSTVYFRKLFTRVMGVAPIVYVKELRIKKAKEMLRSEYNSLADIAQSLGYSSLYHFSKMFKQHTGFSPSEYAKETAVK